MCCNNPHPVPIRTSYCKLNLFDENYLPEIPVAVVRGGRLLFECSGACDRRCYGRHGGRYLLGIRNRRG